MKNSKFIPSVRYINGIEIYFKNKTVIQVTSDGYSVDIVRWDKPGGGRYTESWRPFCAKLCRLNSLENIYQIINLATRYGLMVFKARQPVEPPPGIWIRPSKYVWP